MIKNIKLFHMFNIADLWFITVFLNKMSEKRTSRLSIKSKLEIIEELLKAKPPSKRSLARRYDVTEGSIRYISSNRKIIKHSAIQISDTMINSI